MSKIVNPTMMSKAFSINPNKFVELGIFNPVLNVDTPLFIDPLLLKKSNFKLINDDADNCFTKHFENLIKLLSSSKQEGDLAWRGSLRLLPRKEIDGTCLGYGVNSISGRSISSVIQQTILKTSKEIIELGISDPELFLLLPLFEEGIGPDTISDLTTTIIEPVLLEFTRVISGEMGIPLQKRYYKGSDQLIIVNPLKRQLSPVILLPIDILRDLPVVNSWDEIATASAVNADLRENVNHMIADIWKAKTKKEKQEEREKILQSKEAINILLRVLKEGKIDPYNFNSDKLSILAWHNLLSSISDQFPIELSKNRNEKEDLERIVKSIIEQFRFLVEEKGLNKLLWKDETHPNNEKVVQLLFFATAYSYCKANDTDISPEMDTGIGYVDFKFSKGFSKRIIVETKCSYNPKIVEGYSKQLQAYKKSEETCHGYYVIIDVGRIGKKMEQLNIAYNDDPDKKAEWFYINGNILPSASKR